MGRINIVNLFKAFINSYTTTDKQKYQSRFAGFSSHAAFAHDPSNYFDCYYAISTFTIIIT